MDGIICLQLLINKSEWRHLICHQVAATGLRREWVQKQGKGHAFSWCTRRQQLIYVIGLSFLSFSLKPCFFSRQENKNDPLSLSLSGLRKSNPLVVHDLSAYWTACDERSGEVLNSVLELLEFVMAGQSSPYSRLILWFYFNIRISVSVGSHIILSPYNWFTNSIVLSIENICVGEN